MRRSCGRLVLSLCSIARGTSCGTCTASQAERFAQPLLAGAAASSAVRIHDSLGMFWWGDVVHPGVPPRWFGTHISRQEDKKKGKNSKKKPRAARKKKTLASNRNQDGSQVSRDPSAVPSVKSRDEVGRQNAAEPLKSGQDDSGKGGKAALFTYTGPFSSAVTKVKKLSLFSCFVTLSSVPVMMYLDPALLVEGATATSMTARMSVAGTLGAFGIATTGMLHYFVYPYVHKMTLFDAGNGEKAVSIETMDVLARRRVADVQLRDIEGGAPGTLHPLSTFKDRCSGRIYFIDKDHFYNAELLDVLDPQPLDEDGDSRGEWSD
jgi:hypothetical protein